MLRVRIVLFTMHDDAVDRALALSARANLVGSKPDGVGSYLNAFKVCCGPPDLP